MAMIADFAVASSGTFASLGAQILRIPQVANSIVSSRRFRSIFGIIDYVCCLVWNIIASCVPRGGEPKYLLWGLMFLKVYAIEHVHSRTANVDEKTIRKWAWSFVRLVSDLKIIKWDTRVSHTMQTTATVSVYGTDFRIQEPAPFNPKWFSHKFKAAGLRYEIGICIKRGHIVWVHGAFLCGSYPDLRIFRLGMKKVLRRGEKVIADAGYPDHCCIRTTDGFLSEPRMMIVIRARHETANRRFKHFAFLSHGFRHHLSPHFIYFHAVAHLTQLMIQHDQPIFNVRRGSIWFE